MYAPMRLTANERLHPHPRQDESILDVPIPSASSTAVLRVQLPPQFPDHAPGKE